MKARALIFFIALLFPAAIYSSDWVKVNIDSFATVEMPAYPKVVTSKGKDLYLLRTDTISFNVIESFQYITPHPKNKEELDKEYDSFLEGVAEGAKAQKLKITLVNRKITMFKNLRCLDVEYHLGDSDMSIMTCRFLYVNNHCVEMMTIYKLKNRDTYWDVPERFFKSLSFTNPINSHDQYGNGGRLVFSLRGHILEGLLRIKLFIVIVLLCMLGLVYLVKILSKKRP